MARYPIRFGNYLLLERINVGGMAEVFKAKTFGVAGFERVVAIKRILPNMIEDDEFVKMFIDEARIAVQLTHANIAQIYELGKQGNHYYIAMEYVPSRDLRTTLDRLRTTGTLMSIPQAAFIATKICDGIDYAHHKKDQGGQPLNIIHRDVSPQNVLLSYEGEIKLIDFGIAKAANRASKTQAGVLKGKFGYMSPEQVRGMEIDRRSDIFAVGVLLYEMLTGERLFIGETDFATLEQVRKAEVLPPSRFNPQVPTELDRVLLRCLTREPEDRYQWASELAEDLQRFMIGQNSIFNAKRLADFLAHTYAAEIELEQFKMEEYQRMEAPSAAAEMEASAADEAPAPVQDSTYIIESSIGDIPFVDPAQVQELREGSAPASSPGPGSTPSVDSSNTRITDGEPAVDQTDEQALKDSGIPLSPEEFDALEETVTPIVSEEPFHLASLPTEALDADAVAAAMLQRVTESAGLPIAPPSEETYPGEADPTMGLPAKSFEQELTGTMDPTMALDQEAMLQRSAQVDSQTGTMNPTMALDREALLTPKQEPGRAAPDPRDPTRTHAGKSQSETDSAGATLAIPADALPDALKPRHEASGDATLAIPKEALEDFLRQRAVQQSGPAPARGPTGDRSTTTTAAAPGQTPQPVKPSGSSMSPVLIAIVALFGIAIVVVGVLLGLRLISSSEGGGVALQVVPPATETVPERLEILVDGVLVASKLPASIVDLKPGIHKLVVRAPGFFDFVSPKVTITAGATVTIEAALYPKAGAGGGDGGDTSDADSVTAPGSAGAEPDSGWLFDEELDASDQQSPSTPAQKGSGEMGTVHIVSTPDDATVYIEGRNRGTTPLHLDLERGRTYRISVNLKEFDRWHTKLVFDDAERDIVVELKRGRGPSNPPESTESATLAVNTAPPAQVLIDGKKTRRRTPVSDKDPFKLSIGEHEVSFLTEDKTRFDYRINIEAEGNYTLIIQRLGGPASGTANAVLKE